MNEEENLKKKKYRINKRKTYWPIFDVVLVIFVAEVAGKNNNDEVDDDNSATGLDRFIAAFPNDVPVVVGGDGDEVDSDEADDRDDVDIDENLVLFIISQLYLLLVLFLLLLLKLLYCLLFLNTKRPADVGAECWFTKDRVNLSFSLLNDLLRFLFITFALFKLLLLLM